uniref:RING-type domain-containing protein n=1 Tax=Meloidogyne floridensis TaxID=298350 RepID=A0A915NXW0_9BILA
MLCNKQLNHIEKSLNNKNKIDDHSLNKSLFKTSIVIPSAVQSLLIGNKGLNIKKLQTEFGVKMRLLGDNWLDYPKGRTLQILGDSEEKVVKVRKYIDEEYILKKCEALNIGQKFLGTFEDEQKFVCKEILIPRILTTQSEEDMAKMQKTSGIVEYLYRDSKQDGMRTIILRGTSDSIVKAEKELEIMTAKIKRKSNSVSSFGETIVISNRPPPIFSQQNSTNNFKPLPKFNQKLINTTTNFQKQGNIQNSLSPYSPPLLAKSFINETKNVENNDISVSAFSVQSSKHPAKNFISTEYPNNNDKNEPIFDSVIDIDFNQHRKNEYNIHRNSKFNNSNKCSITSEERSEAEIRELRSENEKLKRQVALKDRELVRLNAVRSCFGCNSSQRSVIFLPCAHFLFCVRCADRNENCQICNREKRNPFSDTSKDGNKNIPKHVSPFAVFDSNDSIENYLNFTTTTQSPDEDLLSKMLVNDMDESVRQMEM